MNLIQANIDDHWEDIKHGIYSIKQETYESETAQDIYRACKNNTASLWLDKNIKPKNGFLITQILKRNYSNEKYLLLWVAWYKEQLGADKFQLNIEKIAKDSGCKSIEFWTNKKEIRDHGKFHGYNKITYKCIKEI
jgi:hypothetical protein|tara:strand:+ start:577 stop:984 length:408 start_codon:yes stop_codon:yes gene_type:complete